MIRRYGLFRTPAHGWIAGVSAGLASRFAVDANVIRLVLVLIALSGRPVLAIVLYAVLALLMPLRPALLDSSYARGDRAWRNRY